jgi:glycine/D-amino acid oxidase-like deaminating enzyme
VSKLRLGELYWLDQERPARARRAVATDLEADVAIVGGGVTGCMVAYFLARSGARVVLVEAERIGHGSTAASTALLMQEPDTDVGELTARLGRAAARQVWKDGRAAVGDLRRTLAALHVDASGHALPSVYFTRDVREAGALRAEHRRRRSASLPGRWLTRQGMRRIVGIEAEGGILTPGNAQVDPYRACIGFAAAAERQGALMFERSKVRRMRGDARGVTLHVGRHRVRASWGVVATGYATPQFKPLASRFTIMSTYVIATPPLTRAERAATGMGDVMVWDTERPYHYWRWTPDGRLLFGGADRTRPPGRARAPMLQRTVRELRRDLAGFYPSLAHVEPDYAWEGLFAVTPDGLPYIGEHRRYPRHLFALGYGGNGMTFSFLAARILTRAIAGRPRPSDALFSFGRR